MYCAISGVSPEEPVVSRKSGHVFEKRLILKALIASGGKCPVTGEDLSEDDLIAVQVSSGLVQPIPSSAASLPGILKHLQDEWDSVALETYRLKQTLAATRQELAHALYQYDAATRVIARLTKERDEALLALQARNVPHQEPHNVESGSDPRLNNSSTLMQSESTEQEVAVPMDGVDAEYDGKTEVSYQDGRYSKSPRDQGRGSDNQPEQTLQEQEQIVTSDGGAEISPKLPKQVMDKISTSYQQLTAARKARKLSQNLATSEDIRQFVVSHRSLDTVSNDQSAIGTSDIGRSSVVALELVSSSDTEFLAVGHADGRVCLHSPDDLSLLSEPGPKTQVDTLSCLTQMRQGGSSVLVGAGRSGIIRAQHVSDLVNSGGDRRDVDPGISTARRPRSGSPSDIDSERRTRYRFTINDGNGAEVTDLSVHPVEILLLSSDARGWWRLHDVEREVMLSSGSVQADAVQGIHCCRIHPDGMIFGLGKYSGEVEMWGLKEMCRVATLKCDGVLAGEAQTICMSENGYYMVVAGSGILRVWDLRKLAVRREETYLSDNCTVQNASCGVALDWSGVFCAATAGLDTVRVFETRNTKRLTDLAFPQPVCETVKTYTDTPPKRLGVCWMRDARGLCAGALDGSVTRFSFKTSTED